MLLILAGVVGVALGFAGVPFIPMTTSLLLAAAGVGVLLLPVLVDRYSLWIFLIGGVALFVFTGGMDMVQQMLSGNREKKKKGRADG